MIITRKFKRNEKKKPAITRNQFNKMIPIAEPIHVGMNTFPHLYIQFVELNGKKAKILWDFSNLKNADELQIRNSYPWDYCSVVQAKVLPKRKSSANFIEYKKDGTVIAIQV